LLKNHLFNHPKNVSEQFQNQNGTLVFTGTNTEITTLFNYLKAGRSIETFLEDYLQVKLDQVLDLLELAEDQLKAISG